MKKELESLKIQNELTKTAPKQLSLLSQKKRHYDSILNKHKLNGKSIQNNLLQTINSYSKSHKLKIIEFLEPHIYNNNNHTEKTYQFQLEGNYNDIINLIHKIEQNTKYGEIINLHFEKKKNYKTGKYSLQASILLKSLI
ncbi:hypothetical protein [Pontimicrobium sp. SW4]|uniref:Uncharacterized protein n=1 Tax=Pontimicrobium sp. SW4 TaxID=3153519 RepID=A0AAU7BQU4_9FLAO